MGMISGAGRSWGASHWGTDTTSGEEDLAWRGSSAPEARIGVGQWLRGPQVTGQKGTGGTHLTGLDVRRAMGSGAGEQDPLLGLCPKEMIAPASGRNVTSSGSV